MPEYLHFWKRLLFLFKAQSEKLLEKLKISVKEEEGNKSGPASPASRAKGSEHTEVQSQRSESHLQTRGREGRGRGAGPLTTRHTEVEVKGHRVTAETPQPKVDRGLES